MTCAKLSTCEAAGEALGDDACQHSAARLVYLLSGFDYHRLPAGDSVPSILRMTTESAQYTPEEERAIRLAASAGEHPLCPRDHALLTHRAIGGGSFGLGYHRTREWLLCPECKRSVLFDRKRGTRL